MHFNKNAPVYVFDPQKGRTSFCFHLNSSFVLIGLAYIAVVGVIGLISEVISEENTLVGWN